MHRLSVRSFVCAFRAPIGIAFTRVPTLLSSLCLLFLESSYGSEGDRAELLQLVKRLATERSFTADEVGTLTGWKLESKKYYPENDKVYSDWLGNVDGLPFKVRAWSSTRGGYLTVRAELPVRPYCIDRSSMLDSFGYKFHQSMLNIEDYPDESSLSAEVKANIKFFGWEPFYKFET